MRLQDGGRSPRLRCPVREPCLIWALDRGVAFGIWGGAMEDERRAMRRVWCHRLVAGWRWLCAICRWSATAASGQQAQANGREAAAR